MTSRSHGDGRRMTLAEAIERRRRMAARFGSVDLALNRGAERAFLRPGGGRIGHRNHDRRWASDFCHVDGCEADAGTDDVVLADGVPVPMCSTCQAALPWRPQPVEVETMEDLASDFLSAVERLSGDAP